jgi:hypothetical protein
MPFLCLRKKSPRRRNNGGQSLIYIIKELVPGKSRSKKRKIHNSNIMGGNFLEAIFLTEFLKQNFFGKISSAGVVFN